MGGERVFCWRKLEPRLLQTNQRAAADLAPLQHYIALQRCGALGCLALHCYIAHYHIATLIHWSIDTLNHWYIATLLHLDCYVMQWSVERAGLKKGLHSLTLHQREEEVEKGKLYNNTFNDQYTFIIVTIIITNSFKSRRENQHI